MRGNLYFGGGQPFVVVVSQKDEVEVREVQLGLRHGGQVVVEKGLTAADRVVRDGTHGLNAGTIVKQKKAATTGGKK